MKRIAILCTIFGSACSGAPVTTTHPLDSPDQYLVSDGSTSALILDGPEGFETVAKRDGAVISNGSEIWVLESKMEDQPQADCSCFMEAMEKQADTTACTSTQPTAYWTLTRLRDGMTVRPFPTAASADSESSSSFQVNGIIDNRLLLEACDGIYACGAAHPSTSCDSVAIDLATGEKSKVATLEPKVDFDKALSALRSTDAGVDLDSTEGLQVTNLRVKFSGSASFVEALVTADACYACSDGEWSSYSISTWQIITASEELPTPVAAYFSKANTAPIWTKVSAENRIAIEGAFAK